MARSIAKDYDEKRGAILATAAGFFAENGFERSSMNKLAVECGVSKALIYHYYSGKEALLYDILFRHLDGLLQDMKAHIPTGDSDEDLRAMVHIILENYRGADNEHKLQLEAMLSLPQDQQKELANIQKQIVTMLSDSIRTTAPNFFTQTPEMIVPVTMSLFGMLNWFFMWYRRGAGVTRPEYADIATNILLGGLKTLASTPQSTEFIANATKTK
ncbi:MAG: TetR/AcrR family transcriptional regulator [Halocynthiibacter sp.]